MKARSWAVTNPPKPLAEHERVKPVGLPPETRKRSRAADSDQTKALHPEPRVQQPLDQQTVWPLDRYEFDLQARQRAAKPPQPLLIMRERARQQLLARRIRNEDVGLLRCPATPA